MKHADLSAVQFYLLGLPRHLKTSSVAFLAFTLIFGLVSQKVGVGVRGGLILAIISFCSSAFKPFTAYSTSMNTIHANGWDDQVAADYGAAQEIKGLCRIGQDFFFGYGTGVAVNLNEVAYINKRAQRTYNESAPLNHNTEVFLQFTLRDGTSHRLAPLDSKHRSLALEALALLRGRCAMSEEVAQLCE